MTWLIVFLGFSLLIVLHELGHYVAARATGMRVEKFFLFFGPKLYSVTRGETEYGIAAIPLGGYVKISGMNPEEEVPPEHEHRAYYRQPVWKRIVVIAAGPVVNIALAFAIFTFVYVASAQQETQRIGETRSGSPAAQVLKPGDEILSVDGKPFSSFSGEKRNEQVREQISSHDCAGKQQQGCVAETPVTLEIKRGGEVRTVTVKPVYDQAVGRTLIGFSFQLEDRDMTVFAAAGEALDKIWFVTERTGSIFSRIFEEEKRKEISGIVGISDVAHQTVQIGAYESLLLLALVSLSLGLVNLLPILPLDGGHIFWAIIEKLRGKPVSFKVMERASAVGFALVIMLMFIGLSNDIGRLNGEGFKVR